MNGMRHVFWLKADGGEFDVVKYGGSLTLDDMRALVGGPPSVHPTKVWHCGEKKSLVVNSDAVISALQLNKQASDWVQASVFGNVFVFVDGDLTGQTA